MHHDETGTLQEPMEALTIDEIISAKKNFLNIDKDLNLIHSVNEIKETYYLIHCVAIITFLLLKQQALAESSAIMLLVVIYFLHRWEFHLSHMIIHNVLLFSHLFEKKYAYELLDKYISYCAFLCGTYSANGKGI